MGDFSVGRKICKVIPYELPPSSEKIKTGGLNMLQEHSMLRADSYQLMRGRGVMVCVFVEVGREISLVKSLRAHRILEWEN